MATSAYSMGNVVLAARDGRRLDGPWLVDAAGRYTDEPRDVILNPMDRESPMTGALLPAGPKGFGMLLMVEMLAALLSGERSWEDTPDDGMPKTADTRDRAAYYSQTLIAISVAHFQEPAAFHASAERMVATLTAMPAAQGFKAVRMPGGGAKARTSAWLAEGVEVRAEEWDMAMTLARRLGFADALPRAAAGA
jgi:L-2-hydroxycarboxylate dehydrogenase (NAD+)